MRYKVEIKTRPVSGSGRNCAEVVSGVPWLLGRSHYGESLDVAATLLMASIRRRYPKHSFDFTFTLQRELKQ